MPQNSLRARLEDGTTGKDTLMKFAAGKPRWVQVNAGETR